MESAIPKALQCPRTQALRMGGDFTPPYPAFTARAQPGTAQVVMAYFGVQSHGAQLRLEALQALRQIVKALAMTDGPGHTDLAHYTDEAGYDSLIAIAYWNDPRSFARWQSNSAIDSAWQASVAAHGGLGYFREIAMPGVQSFETLFNSLNYRQGVGCVMAGVSGEIREHAYWGGARDRLPLAQTSALQPRGALASNSAPTGDAFQVSVSGHENLALIRSGQDWTDTTVKERELYLNQMEPVLREGMQFLRDQGLPIGCYSNRYMRHIDVDGNEQQKTFGLSYWRSLADLERWSLSHPTHVAIFSTFMRIVAELEFKLTLRLYHEVSVLQPGVMQFDYLNCHPKTGLMNGVA